MYIFFNFKNHKLRHRSERKRRIFPRCLQQNHLSSPFHPDAPPLVALMININYSLIFLESNSHLNPNKTTRIDSVAPVRGKTGPI